MELLLEHWTALALGLITFLDLIVSITPTKRDDQVLGYFRVIIEALSSRKKRKKQ